MFAHGQLPDHDAISEKFEANGAVFVAEVGNPWVISLEDKLWNKSVIVVHENPVRLLRGSSLFFFQLSEVAHLSHGENLASLLNSDALSHCKRLLTGSHLFLHALPSAVLRYQSNA